MKKVKRKGKELEKKLIFNIRQDSYMYLRSKNKK